MCNACQVCRHRGALTHHTPPPDRTPCCYTTPAAMESRLRQENEALKAEIRELEALRDSREDMQKVLAGVDHERQKRYRATNRVVRGTPPRLLLSAWLQSPHATGPDQPRVS